MSNASQAINSLDQTINSFKSRVDVKVNDVNTSTANIQATTKQGELGSFKIAKSDVSRCSTAL